VTGSSASQSWRFSLVVVIGQKWRFCGPKGQNAMQISAFDFSKPQNVASLMPFFSDAV